LAVADHLLITVSQTQVLLRYEGLLVKNQKPLRMPMPSKTFIPEPWRKFRQIRAPEQLIITPLRDYAPLPYDQYLRSTKGQTGR
jgi:hypothetical protein